MTSTGADLGAADKDTIGEIMTLFGGAAGMGTNYVAGINVTITKYDARGQAVQVIEPQRELSVGGTRQTLTTSRTYNAFGEVKSETNALGATVDYLHNTMGRVIRTESPLVNVTSEAGVTTAQRPTEYMYYDRSGRLVASRDANGNLTRMTLLAGTGYGGTEALVTQVTQADGAVINTMYDIHGNRRYQYQAVSSYTNGSNQTVERYRMSFQNVDRMGRVIESYTLGRERNAVTGEWTGGAYYYDSVWPAPQQWSTRFC